ncbi:MtrAB system accessory lipoprotein LpqB [Fodinibacter luteus]|uniref:MtrAB system accessory lipoprotein LpqB n=1 Tax=Fodinibacter luteus TaxID=552064 RepID=A0ABP8KKD4_9MICO
MTTPRRATASGLLFALLVTLALAGCGGLSSAGPVEQGLDVGSGNPPDLRVTFPGPVPGAQQETIVRGFVRAGAASDAAYDNARAFLTTQVSEAWNPDGTIVLLADAAPPTATLLDPATVRIQARAAGTIDADGRYTAARPGSTVTAEFGLQSVGGEWRIAALPEGFGRWIASTEVSRLVQPHSVHYVSTSRRALVPDVRWFPADKLATRLALAQIAPLPEHLTGAAVTAVPVGARLLGDAVSVDAGVATVNLISGRLAPGETTRQNLWAQFVATLTQDAGVTRVALSVDGVPVNLLGLDESAGTLAEVGFSAPATPPLALPVARRGADVVVFDPSGLGDQEPRQPTGARTYPQVPQDFRRLALSADGGELAGVDPGGDGISRWRGTNRYEVPLEGKDVGNPSYDQRGFLWVGAVGSGAEGPRVWVVNTSVDPAAPGAAATPVEARWLAGRRVLEARVAPDGDRVAVLSVKGDGSDTRVDIAGVVRGAAGLPERLAPPLRIGAPLTRATSLAWLDFRTLAAIGVLEGSTVQPVVLTVGGDVRGLRPVPGAVAVASTGGERDMWVVTSAGRLFGRAGSQWVDSGPATDLAVAAG